MQIDNSKRRNPGYVEVRRGLLAHLPEMSSNATKLFLWFILRAYWSGSKRGLVEASFDDMAQGNGWSLKTLQRTIEELEAKPYIAVERAANQYEMTRVRILKYDVEESTSAVDKSVQSKIVGVDCAVDSGVDKFDCSAVHSNPATPQNQQDLHAPKKVEEVKEVKKGTADAVRRRVDAELHLSIKPFSKSKKLQIRLAERIKQDDGPFSDWIEDARKRGHEHPFGPGERKAFAATGYTPDLKSPFLSPDFVYTVVEVYDENVGKDLAAGNLCSKIIDRCVRERKGNGGAGYYWPPDFQEHRDELRAQERMLERRSSSTLEARP